MSTGIYERIEALPRPQRDAFWAFFEYLEWKARIPTCGQSGTPDRRALGARLREVRGTLKQTEEQAADVAGLTLTTYRAYEVGRIGRWGTKKMLAYAETWNVSLDWLLEGTGTMFRDGKPPHIEIVTVQSPPAEEALAIRRRARTAVAEPSTNVIDWQKARAKNGGAK